MKAIEYNAIHNTMQHSKTTEYDTHFELPRAQLQTSLALPPVVSCARNENRLYICHTAHNDAAIVLKSTKC
ncbi:hypothetical protein ACOMHN_039743 [Nucella lapillus]